MAKVACAWFRNDLRVHDSPVLHRAAAVARQRGTHVLPVYVLDPRHFRRTRYGTLKTGPVRALFLLQSILALKRRLRKLGSDLLVRVGKPEVVLPPLLSKGSLVLTQTEVTSEELGVDKRVRTALGDGVDWEYCWGSTLFHKEDLPFPADLRGMPDVYTSFKNKVEPELACKANEVPPTFNGRQKQVSQMNVRPCLPDPASGSLPIPNAAAFDFDYEPSWGDLPYAEAVDMPSPHEGGVLEFHGGEDAGLERLQYYVKDTQLVASYFDTRNEMLGGDYSTKFAPWLAHGCISVRKVFEQIREHESVHAASKSTYWTMFALGARDFYRFFALKHGDAIFRPGGIVGRKPVWKGGDREFELWATGRTGYPFVDANMRELRATGFMSNRGRQNVASFLALDLDVDWRRGADWFESYLIDYDVAANWCNWVFAAGLAGGRLNRFNVMRQSKNYDPDGEYIRHWVPELRDVPAPFIHEPWLLAEHDRTQYGAQAYPPPCIDPGTFPSGAGPTPVQLKGLKGRGKGSKGSKGSKGATAARSAAQSPAADDGSMTDVGRMAGAEAFGRRWNRSSDAGSGSASVNARHGDGNDSELAAWLRDLGGGGEMMMSYAEAMEKRFQSVSGLLDHYKLEASGDFDATAFCDDHGINKRDHRRLVFRWASSRTGQTEAAVAPNTTGKTRRWVEKKAREPGDPQQDSASVDRIVGA